MFNLYTIYGKVKPRCGQPCAINHHCILSFNINKDVHTEAEESVSRHDSSHLTMEEIV